MKKNSIEIIATISLILACLFFYYSKIILSPDSYLAVRSSDGIKSYAVFAGHIKNDTDYTNYRNMNYPYGQTHIFTDGQTGLANTFKFLSKKIPFFDTHSIAIFNLLLIFSYAGCAFFLCLILQRLNMSSLFVILGSVGITLMSPQIFRMGGHPTLSYAVFFPLSWWLFIRFFESEKKMRFTGLIILNSAFWFFIHPYYVMLNTIFYLGYYLVLFVQQRFVFGSLKTWMHAFLQIALPLLLTRLYILAVDHHEGRSEFPYGFWAYYAKLNTVFAPIEKPFNEVFQSIFGYTIENQNWEGWAYIGMGALVMLFYSLFRMIRYLLRKRMKRIVTPSLPAILRASVWASVLALVFSMCMPFRLFADWLYDHLAFLQQFRSLGRFAWIFYYVFTVYALYLTYLVYRKWKMKDRRVSAFLLSLVVLSLYFVESYAYHRENSKQIEASPNLFNPSMLSADTREVIDKINNIKNEYQCLIPFPYYYVGNENFSTWSSDKMLTNSFVISYYTDVPMLANSSARSPIPEGRNNMQFFTPPFSTKEIQKDMPGTKPFMILCDNEDINEEERFWILNSKEIFRNGSFVLYELPYEKVFTEVSGLEIKNFESGREKLIHYNGLLVTELPDTIAYYNFDQMQSPQIFRGSGAFTGVKNEYEYVFEKRKCFLKKNQDYTLSFWYYNKGELRNQITLILEECDKDGKACKWELIWNPARSMKIIGDWSLVEGEFRIGSATEQISLFFRGDDHSKQEFYADDLIIRPSGIKVYYDVSPDSPTYRSDIISNGCMRSQTLSKEELRAKRIADIANAIRRSPDWLNKVKEKAVLKSIPLDSMITLDAIYMYEEEIKESSKN